VTRPAFYALESGGWRDYVTILHLPYTGWHLSYVAIGAALAPELEGRRLLAALAAFALALGIGAHALDELHDRPLETRISDRALIALAALSIGGAIAIGVAASLLWTPWLLVFVAVGGFLVVAYNLELFGGAFHSDLWFGLAWGAFPVLTAYFVTAEELTETAILAASFALVTSLAQRVLSTQVRNVRRRGTGDPAMLAAPEAALRLLSLAMIVLAAALLSLRW
jgi:4-hydroxybenzoate polyprenyltransferase